MPCCSTIHDGNIVANSLCFAENILGFVNRPRGCKLSFSNLSKVQEIPFIRFCFQIKHFQFRAMLFGLATAPSIFAKLMSTVESCLKKYQIKIDMHLDD